MSISIETIGCFVPETRLDVRRDYAALRIDAAVARVISQLYELPNCPVSFCSDDELLFNAAIKTTADGGFCYRITALIYAHTGAVIGPFGRSMPTILARRLRIDPAMVFGTCQYNCVSVLSAIDLAERILAHEDDDARVLILVGENAHNLEIRIIPNVAIVGDAACAALVRRNGDDDRLLGLATHVHHGFSEGIWLLATSNVSRTYEAHFQMWLREVIEDALSKAAISLQDIDWILPHNVNVWMWRKAAAFLDFPIERIFLENARRFAHCQGSDMFLNLEGLKRSQQLKKGDRYLMVTAGVGGVFGAAVFQH